MQKKKLLNIITYAMSFALSVLLIASAYLVNISDKANIASYEQTYTAFSDSKGNVTVISPYNNLTVELDEYGEILDLKIAQNSDRIFYTVKENETSTLVSRRLSSLVYDKITLCENVKSYLLSNDASSLLVLTDSGSLKYITIERNTPSVTDLSADVAEFYLSEDGSSAVYATASSIFAFDEKNGSRELIGDASVIYTSSDLSSILAKKGTSLVFCNTITGEQNIISNSLDTLLFANENTIYYTEKTSDESKLALFCSDTKTSTLVSNNVCNIPFVGTFPIIVYTEYKSEVHVDELAYKVLVKRNTNGITTLSGSEYSGFAQNDSGSLIFMNDVSKDQELLIRASVENDTLSSLTVIDTDVKQICGILSDSIVYIKDFSPVSLTASLCCNGRQLRSVDIIDTELAPTVNTRPLRTYEWVNRGIKYTGFACVETISGDHVIYESDNTVFAFDGEDEFTLSNANGSINNAIPLIGSSIIYLDNSDNTVTALANGKVKSLSVRASAVLTINH